MRVNHSLSAQTLKPTKLELVAQQSHCSFPTSYSNLLSSQQLQRLFLKYPLLRAQIKLVYKAALEPSRELSQENCEHHQQFKGRNDSDRHRGRGRVRGGGRAKLQNERINSPWTQERGMKHAVRLLKDITGRNDKVGTGMEEFSKLVMKLHEDTLSVGISTTSKVLPDAALEKNQIEPGP